MITARHRASRGAAPGKPAPDIQVALVARSPRGALLLALAVAGALSGTAFAAAPAHGKFGFIDARTVQSAVIYELNTGAPTCHSILEGDAICPTAGRHYELKQSEVVRALALVNDPLHYEPTAHTSCAVPRQAIVLSTTRGKRAVDISLECNNVGGRAPTRATRTELAQMLRSFGLVAHVPVVTE